MKPKEKARSFEGYKARALTRFDKLVVASKGAVVGIRDLVRGYSESDTERLSRISRGEEPLTDQDRQKYIHDRTAIGATIIEAPFFGIDTSSTPNYSIMAAMLESLKELNALWCNDPERFDQEVKEDLKRELARRKRKVSVISG